MKLDKRDVMSVEGEFRMMSNRVGLFNSSFQDFKRYGIPKAQLILTDIPYSLGDRAYGSNPVWYNGRDNGSDYDHPTQKPVALSGMAIDHTTKEGDIVLDLFGGSGSTMIACEQLGRKCRMMELDPHYCDVIIARWEKLTGQKAIKLNK
jgi:DNA modification methylase